MQTSQYKYLKFVRFRDFFQWDLKRYFNQSIHSKFQIFNLGTLISEEKDKFDVSDPKTDYGILGVNNQTGIFDAYIENGSKIKQKYKKMEVGWIAYNPYRVNVGSVGIKRECHNNVYISPAYVVFSCKQSLDPEFLYMALKTPLYNRVVRENTTGSVRQNLSFEVLSTLPIPLPTMAEQQAFVEAYNAKIKAAEEKERRAEQLNNEIEDYLLSELGASVSKTRIAKGLNFVHFKDISRWDVQFFTSTIKTKSKFHKTTLARCINNFMNDKNGHSLRRETYKSPNQEFRYIGMESVEKETGFLLDLPIVKGSEVKSQTIEVPAGYFIYGKLRPYLNKYWLNETDDSNIVCSSEFFVFDVKQDINRLFFKYVLSSGIVQKQISDATSGARMPRINETVFKNICIPLPPIEIQNTIVEHITELKDNIKRLKQEAKELRENALVEFEKEIFEN